VSPFDRPPGHWSQPGGGNLAREPVDYRVVEGRYLVTRIFVYPSGLSYVERTSRATLLGWPLLHMTAGRCPETGRRTVAKGWVAVGRLAVGGIAVGQVAVGVLAIAQLGFALILLLGQAGLSGHTAVAQLGAARVTAVGQLVVAGREAVGQLAAAPYALGQVGLGRHVVDGRRRDPEAVAHFQTMRDRLLGWLGVTPPTRALPAERSPGSATGFSSLPPRLPCPRERATRW
jgi:hypothetical protein